MSAEEAEGSSRRKKPTSTEYRADEAIKGEKAKIEDKLETTNSDNSGDKSETSDSVQMFDSETPNELTRRQHRENKGLGKGGTSREANQKGRGAWYRTGRGARVRREARRN